MYAGAAFGILTKTDDCWTHYAAVTRHRFIKLAHRRCIGLAVMLWLAIALANWLTAGVRIIVGDLQNKISDNSDTNTDHYAPKWFGWQIRHSWQSISEFSEHFGVALWFTAVLVSSSLTATSAKPDAQICQGLFLTRVIKHFWPNLLKLLNWPAL